MNIVTWNVNGIRANHKKGLYEKLVSKPSEIDFPITKQIDVIAIQETKANYEELQSVFFPNGYVVHHHSATERKGYSGVVIYVKEGISHKRMGFDDPCIVSLETIQTEGRLICLEFDDFFLINCYFPNGGGKPERLIYKIKFYEEFALFCDNIGMLHKKHIVFCGDFNIAHNEIDIARPKENEKHVGFLREERDILDNLHKKGYIDVFRNKNPETVIYTWWDMKTRSRDRNIGWRIDGFYVNEGFMRNITDIQIYNNVIGSDHCPVVLTIKK